eukprot:5232581-Pyramimonas_sp.AAC.1
MSGSRPHMRAAATGRPYRCFFRGARLSGSLRRPCAARQHASTKRGLGGEGGAANARCRSVTYPPMEFFQAATKGNGTHQSEEVGQTIK